jgi:cytochrome c oxidase subunit 1
LGLAGMPRRYLDYPDAFLGWNVVSSYGSYLSRMSFVYFFYIVYLTLAYGPKCADNPWTTDEKQGIRSGLEWVLPSPPAFHTFGDQLPVIRPTPQLVSFFFKFFFCEIKAKPSFPYYFSFFFSVGNVV